SMFLSLFSHCSRGLGSWGGAGASVTSISAYLVFLGLYNAVSLSMRVSATLTLPMWNSPGRPSRWSSPMPVINEKTVFLPVCGKPINAIFMERLLLGAQGGAERFDA